MMGKTMLSDISMPRHQWLMAVRTSALALKSSRNVIHMDHFPINIFCV